MRFRIAGAVTALAVLATTVAAVAPADAQRWRYRHHGGWWGPAAGFAAGAIIGGALAPRPYYYDPGYAYVEGPGPEDGDIAYCQSRYKSYDPASGTYLGYDGQRHPCP